MKEAAAAHDKANRLGSKPKRHNVMTHEFFHGDDDDDDFEVGLDTPVEDYMVHLQDVKRDRSSHAGSQRALQAGHDDFLPKEVYRKMSSTDRQKWKSIDPQVRKLVVSLMKRPSISVNLTDIQEQSDDDEDGEESSEDDASIDGDHGDDDDGVIDLLINIMKSGKSANDIPPGDIRRVLSSSASKKLSK